MDNHSNGWQDNMLKLECGDKDVLFIHVTKVPGPENPAMPTAQYDVHITAEYPRGSCIFAAVVNAKNIDEARRKALAQISLQWSSVMGFWENRVKAIENAKENLALHAAYAGIPASASSKA